MPTVQARTLRRASAIMGGTQALAAKLGVVPLKLQDWIEGSALPPNRVFLMAVDIVVAHDAVRPNPPNNPGSGNSPADKGEQR